MGRRRRYLPTHVPSYLGLVLTVPIRILRREPELTQFETAQIANLCPADAEEAKSIIPRCVRWILSADPLSRD
jgi:RNA polymerase Rpb4